jgi:hypothetical protein
MNWCFEDHGGKVDPPSSSDSYLASTGGPKVLDVWVDYDKLGYGWHESQLDPPE